MEMSILEQPSTMKSITLPQTWPQTIVMKKYFVYEKKTILFQTTKASSRVRRFIPEHYYQRVYKANFPCFLLNCFDLNQTF